MKTQKQLNLTPFLSSLVGIESLFDQIQTKIPQNQGYPPHNIELVSENNYEIALAVAGFSKDEITIEHQENSITVTGKLNKKPQDRKFIHKGISDREFEKKFMLGEYIKVKGADLKDGLLIISLEKVIPEEKKPTTIAIGSSTTEDDGIPVSD